MLRSLALATLLTAFAPQGCELPFTDEFRYESQQHHLLPDADGDSLRYVEILAGLSSTGSSSVPALEALVERRRVYPPEGGFLHLDLDEPFEQDDYDLTDARERQLAALLEQLPDCVVVEDAGLFLDAGGELCAWRVTRIEPLGRVLATLDALVSVSVLEELGRDLEQARSFPWLDAASVELARQRALAGGPWVRRVDGRLALDWPLSATGAARALEQVATRTEDPPLAPWFCSQVAGLTVGEGRVLAMLGSATDASVRFHPPALERRDGPDEELIEALREAGLALDGPDALARALAPLSGD